MLFVKATGARGRGLFSDRDAQPNDILTACPCLADETAAFQASIASDYIFEHPTQAGRSVLPLGLCALANHSETPNATWDFHESAEPPLMYLRATRPIARGEELLLHYGPEYWSSRPRTDMW